MDFTPTRGVMSLAQTVILATSAKLSATHQPYFPVCTPSSWFHTVICCRDHTYSLSVTRCSASPLAVASLRYESLLFANVCVYVCMCLCRSVFIVSPTVSVSASERVIQRWASGISTCCFASCSIFLLGLLPDKTVWIQAYEYECVHERACVCVSQYELRVLSPDQSQLHTQEFPGHGTLGSRHVRVTWRSIKTKNVEHNLMLSIFNFMDFGAKSSSY